MTNSWTYSAFEFIRLGLGIIYLSIYLSISRKSTHKKATTTTTKKQEDRKTTMQQQQQQQQQPQQYTASAPYPVMMPMVSHPTFRRINARHATFRVGVGGIFLSALLFIVGYSAPAWIDQKGLWMSCGSSCVSNVASGRGEWVVLWEPACTHTSDVGYLSPILMHNFFLVKWAYNPNILH